MKKKFQWWQVEAPLSLDNDDDYNWCEDMYGTPCYTARWWYEPESKKFYFRNEKDALWFELMWSSSNESSNT